MPARRLKIGKGGSALRRAEADHKMLLKQDAPLNNDFCANPAGVKAFEQYFGLAARGSGLSPAPEFAFPGDLPAACGFVCGLILSGAPACSCRGAIAMSYADPPSFAALLGYARAACQIARLSKIGEEPAPSLTKDWIELAELYGALAPDLRGPGAQARDGGMLLHILAQTFCDGVCAPPKRQSVTFPDLYKNQQSLIRQTLNKIDIAQSAANPGPKAKRRSI